MTEEYYEKNIFGDVVNVGLEEPTEEDYESEKVVTGRKDFNIFAFTDAVGARKKRDAWVLFHKALASGMVAEEIFFKIVWQVRTMLLASKTKTAEEAEMKAYPYSKAKGFLKNFKSVELEKLSESLVVGYHQARRGKGEIETLTEKTLLKL